MEVKILIGSNFIEGKNIKGRARARARAVVYVHMHPSLLESPVSNHYSPSRKSFIASTRNIWLKQMGAPPPLLANSPFIPTIIFIFKL